MSALEVVLDRGDRSLSDVVEKAFRMGVKMDAWSEFFDFDLWKKAFDESGIDMNLFLSEIPLDAKLPWDHISTGVSKAYLKKST